ncbi:hypothetical protein JCM11491_000130 [Sporobolomyces phaffii]
MAPAKDKLWLAAARRSTFSNRRKGKNEPLNWPHPITQRQFETSTIHPDHLAHAGFYSTPHLDDPTVTTCFACGVLVGQWDEGESPLARHLAAAAEPTDDGGGPIECPWATLVHASWAPAGGLAGTSRDEWDARWGPDAEFHPRGAVMERARRGTFDLGWPHHGKKGFPTADEIAAAGFYFCPQPDPEASDQCDCPYCGRSAENWEAGDDPVKIHNRKDGEHCPFFLAPLPGSAAAGPEPKPKSKPKAKRAKASTASASSSTTLTATATASQDKVPSAGGGSKKSKKAVVQEDEAAAVAAEAPAEDDDHEDPPEPRTRTTRSASVSTAAPPPRPTRRAKATPAPSEDETEQPVVAAAAAPALKKSTRSRTTTTATTAKAPKSTRSRKVEAADPNDETTAEIASTSSSTKSKPSKQVVLPNAASSAAAASKGRAKKKNEAVSVNDGEEDEEEDAAAVLPSTSSGNGKENGAREPVASSFPADESITDLAMIANAAFELQPSSTEEVEVKKPAKKSSKSKGKGKGKGQGKDKNEVDQGEEEVVGEAPVSAPSGGKTSIPPTSEPTSSTTTGRQIRALPTKVNPTKSPSSTSLAGVAAAPSPRGELAPPVPTVPALDDLPATAPATATATATATASLAPPPPHLFVPSDLLTTNALSPDRIARVLPAPTADELATLTVGEWYALNAARIRRALERDDAARHAELVERIGAAADRLDRLRAEAGAREAAEADDKRRKKKQLQASARKQQTASARKAVRG